MDDGGAPLPNPGVKIVQRIPKGARHLAATKLTEVLDRCTEENTTGAWSELFNFAWCRIYQPPAGDKNSPNTSSLTTKLKNQLNSVNPSPSTLSAPNSRKKTRKKKKPVDDVEKLAQRVESKLAEGDMRGAVRILSSQVGLALFS